MVSTRFDTGAKERCGSGPGNSRSTPWPGIDHGLAVRPRVQDTIQVGGLEVNMARKANTCFRSMSLGLSCWKVILSTTFRGIC